MKNKYFFARFWQLTMILTILTQFLVIFISKTRGLLLKFFFADDFKSPSPITSIFLYEQFSNTLYNEFFFVIFFLHFSKNKFFKS
jgi:hypothetical protein